MQKYNNIYLKVSRNIYYEQVPGGTASKAKAKEEFDEQAHLI